MMMISSFGYRSLALARGGGALAAHSHGGRPLACLLHRSAVLQKQAGQKSAYGVLESVLRDDGESKPAGQETRTKKHSGLSLAEHPEPFLPPPGLGVGSL